MLIIGIEEAVFAFENTEMLVVDVGGQRSERRKWIASFDDVTAIIFCASLNGFDQVLREDHSQNRLDEAILLFDEVANSNCFYGVEIILFLNKLDLFEDKIKKVNLADWVEGYQGGPDPEQASEHIKSLFLAKTNSRVYTHKTVAVDTENMFHVINDVRSIITNQVLRMGGL